MRLWHNAKNAWNGRLIPIPLNLCVYDRNRRHKNKKASETKHSQTLYNRKAFIALPLMNGAWFWSSRRHVTTSLHYRVSGRPYSFLFFSRLCRRWIVTLCSASARISFIWLYAAPSALESPFGGKRYAIKVRPAFHQIDDFQQGDFSRTFSKGMASIWAMWNRNKACIPQSGSNLAEGNVAKRQ